MLVELLLVLGLVTGVQPGDPCIDALHELRVLERMQIESTETLEDNVIAFTLTDGPRISSKTAILVCRRDVEDDHALEEGSADEEEMTLEDVGQEDDLDEADDGSFLDDDEEAAE